MNDSVLATFHAGRFVGRSRSIPDFSVIYSIAWISFLGVLRSVVIPAARRIRRPGYFGNVSLGCFPILFYLAGHFGSITGMWIFAGLIWAGTIVLAARTESAKSLAKIVRPLLAACALGLFFLITLSDLQWGRNLLSSATELDYVKHVAVTATLFRNGADGINPFFHPMQDVGLFYYQFWHLVCSLVEHVGSPLITARDAVLGASLGRPWD